MRNAATWSSPSSSNKVSISPISSQNRSRLGALRQAVSGLPRRSAPSQEDSSMIAEQKPPIASVVDLVKNYYMESVVVRALRGVTLDFYEGDFVALMGPSGSGKSTLLNLLGCLDRPTDGQYYLGEEDVSEMDDDQLSEVRSKYIGFIFQSYNLLAQYTVVENIEIPLLYQGCRLDAETRERCIRAAEMVGLADRLDHRPSQLSGGQQQRVAIARSLINDPHIILADEPTGNLDTTTSDEIMRLLTLLNQAGKTIIMVTHENDIAAWARRVVRMRDGHIESDSRNETPRGATH